MKKSFLLALILVATAYPLKAAEQPGRSKGHFLLGIGAGIAFPVDTLFRGLGFGGQISLGYSPNENLALYLADQIYIFYTAGGTVNLIAMDFAPTVKYAFGQGGIKPYILGGAGLQLNIISSGPNSLSSEDFIIQLGTGLQVKIAEKVDFFLEVKYTRAFDPKIGGSAYDGSGFCHLPILCGLNFN